MVIREATKKDIPNLIELGLEFYSHGQLAGTGIEFDYKSGHVFFKTFIEMENAVVFIGEDDIGLAGAVIGHIMPTLFSADLLMLNEIWWFVSERARKTTLALKLIKNFKQFGIKNGCTTWTMVTTANDSEKNVIRFYEKQGMKHLEHHYIGRL